MKLLKKSISFLLVIAMVLASFCLTSLADDLHSYNYSFGDAVGNWLYQIGAALSPDVIPILGRAVQLTGSLFGDYVCPSANSPDGLHHCSNTAGSSIGSDSHGFYLNCICDYCNGRFNCYSDSLLDWYDEATSGFGSGSHSGSGTGGGGQAGSTVSYSTSGFKLHFHLDESKQVALQSDVVNGYITDLHVAADALSFNIGRTLGSYGAYGYMFRNAGSSWYSDTFTIESGNYDFTLGDITIVRGGGFGSSNYKSFSLQKEVDGSWSNVVSYDLSSYASGGIFSSHTFGSKNLISGYSYRFLFKSLTGTMNPYDVGTGSADLTGYPASVTLSGVTVSPASAGTGGGGSAPSSGLPAQFITNIYNYNAGDNSYSYYDDHSIIDNSVNVFWNPVTNNYYDFSGWEFDFSDRSYTIDLSDNSQVTVVYGDEYITINQGGDTYYVYYYVDLPPEEPSEPVVSYDDSVLLQWLQAFKEWLGEKLDDLGITVNNDITQYLDDDENDEGHENLFEWLIDLFKTLIEGIVHGLASGLEYLVEQVIFTLTDILLGFVRWLFGLFDRASINSFMHWFDAENPNFVEYDSESLLSSLNGGE